MKFTSRKRANILCSICLICIVTSQVVNAQIDVEQLTADERQVVDKIISFKKEQIDKLSEYAINHKHHIGLRVFKDLIFKSLLQHSLKRPRRSTEILEFALVVARSIESERFTAFIHFHLGKAYLRQGNIKRALQYYLKSEMQFSQIMHYIDLIYVCSDIGHIYLLQNDRETARLYFERSLGLSTYPYDSSQPKLYAYEYGLASSYSGLATIALSKYDVATAIKNYQIALYYYKALNNQFNSYAIQISEHLRVLGRLYREEGAIVKSLRLYKEAYQYSLTINRQTLQAEILNSIGVLYLEQEDYVKASKYFNDSLKIYLSNKTHAGEGTVLLNLGVIQQRRGNIISATKYFNDSLEKAKLADDKNIIIAAGEGLGAIYRVKGDFSSAINILDSSLDLAKDLGDKVRIAEILWRKAEVFYDMRRFDQSVELATQSLHLADELKFSNLSILASTLLAKSLLKTGEKDEAVEALNHAINIIEDRRNQIVGQEHGQQLYFENKVTPYHLLIDVLVKEGKTLEALAHAEKAKSRVLFDALSERRSSTNISNADEEERRKLNQEIVALNKELRAEIQRKPQDQERIGKIRAELAGARLKHSIYLDLLQASKSDQIRQKQTAHIFPNDGLSRLGLTKYDVVVGYTVMENVTYVFTISRSVEENMPELSVRPIEISQANLRQQVSSLQDLLAKRSISFNSASRQIYDLLIKPFEGELIGKNKVCIIPDDILWDAPFQTLIASNGRYLIEDYSIFYVPSLSVYLQMKRKSGPSTIGEDNSLLAFGNPIIGDQTVQAIRDQQRGDNFEPLPHAELEVKTVVPIFSRGKSMALLGAEAEERVFKAKAGEYRTIHLATHGVLDNQNPLYSYLLLSRKEDDLEEDGILEAREILELDLNADMVVLSACETARGRIGSGEGVIGMAWAFFVAGCRSTIVSQWKVDSEGTAKFMIGFYRALESSRRAGKPSRSDALRAAALGMMKNVRYRHPYYWAGFVMIGLDN